MNEVLKELISHIELPADQLKDQDPEIREIFIEEVQEIIEFLNSALPQWIQNPSDTEILTEIRRSYHTLKGSGRMAGALQSGELAWSIEEMLNRVLAGTITLTNDIQELVYSVAVLYKSLIKDFEQNLEHTIDIRPWIVTAKQLRDGQEVNPNLRFTINYHELQQIPEDNIELNIVQEEKIILPEEPIETIKLPNQQKSIENQTLEIFFEESFEHLETISEFLNLQIDPEIEQFNQLIRAIHTIRGSSGMVGIETIFVASSNLENVYKNIDQEKYAEELGTEKQLLLEYYEYVKAYVSILAIHGRVDKLEILDTQFSTLWDHYEQNIDISTVNIHSQGLVAELLALDINELLDAEFTFIDEIQKNSEDYLSSLIQQATVLQNHTLSRQTEVLHQVSIYLQRCYQALSTVQNNQYPVDVLEKIQHLHQYLIDVFDGLASGQNIVMTHLMEEEFEDVISKILSLNINSSAHTALNLDHSTNTEFDTELLDIFLEESEELITEMDTDFSIWEQEPENTEVLKNLFRHLHTLKGGANMVQATHLGEIAHELESIYERVLNGQLHPTMEAIQIIRYAQDDIAMRLQRLHDEHIDQQNLTLIENLRAIIQGTEINSSIYAVQQTDSTIKNSTDQNVEVEIAESSQPSSESVIDSIPLYIADSDEKIITKQFDTELLDIFLEESEELITEMDTDFSIWEQEPENTEVLKNLFRHLHTLKGGANMVQATHLGEIAHELESIYERVLNGQLHPTVEAIQIIRYAQDDIAMRLQRLHDEHIDVDNTQLIQYLHQISSKDLQQSIAEQPSLDVEPINIPTQNPTIVTNLDVLKTQEVSRFSAAEQQTLIEETPTPTDAFLSSIQSNLFRPSVRTTLDNAIANGDDDKVIILESYLEEAEELLQQSHILFSQWVADRSNRSILLTLQRTFHTLKGNSRIIQEQLIADIAYQLEVIFEQFSIYQFTSERYDKLIHQTLVWLKNAIFHGMTDGVKEIKARMLAIKYEDSFISTEEDNSFVAVDAIDFGLFKEEKVVQGDGSIPPSMYAQVEQKQEQNVQEQIRISADLVEKMIDLSGESAINRSRIELDLGQMTYTLSEMELAIQRLADQLRRMDGELETQILAKHEVTGQRYEEFDLLEMDQYSSLNQLSKSLAESASDLIDFKSTLAEKIRDTENLLLQQSRIQNELQQSLMGTRLVPFARLVPRLQRLVRQTAVQLNRPVDLNIENTEGELDRNILERLVSPLEHMLRNAIDHGIEDAETRHLSGKPEKGRINLNIAREGNDILVIFSDDGHGIDVEAVKIKAQQTGLIDSDVQISDFDAMQYIFNAGLTTAKKVTQISGRGVGLDVVQSEIKALGGHVSVTSQLGVGTEFTIRVPTSVAVSDALMVKVGDQQFALPLAQIERIVRVSPVALAEYYNSRDEHFELDQTAYRLRYVGEFVTGQAKPTLNNMGSSVPVIIYNSGGRSVALHVDQLVGSRAQIVIKPVGKQMASVGYVGGATILADGRVCLILDGQTISRRILTTIRSHQTEQNISHSSEIRALRKTVMVVDDSVTVRKVTSRLLERQGFDVVTAKDGVDAIEKLAQITPDLMLLDIEMPRMDGFEVANYIRHDSQHKQLPIIMITSRTGEKHREHALSLGVNSYMGKPFQEAELLENINIVLNLETVN